MLFFLFKQKTAYEMRISDWGSDVCSSDLVSLASGEQCAAALREAGYQVSEIDVTRDVGALIAALDPRPDVVFNALHGRYGEDGCIQGLLNQIGRASCRDRGCQYV